MIVIVVVLGIAVAIALERGEYQKKETGSREKQKQLFRMSNTMSSCVLLSTVFSCDCLTSGIASVSSVRRRRLAPMQRNHLYQTYRTMQHGRTLWPSSASCRCMVENYTDLRRENANTSIEIDQYLEKHEESLVA